jgi:hypothetical protein
VFPTLMAPPPWRAAERPGASEQEMGVVTGDTVETGLSWNPSLFLALGCP